MRKIVNYDIHVRDSQFELYSSVNDRIKYGWVPIGGVSVHINVKNREEYRQAMVKYEEEVREHTQEEVKAFVDHKYPILGRSPIRSILDDMNDGIQEAREFSDEITFADKLEKRLDMQANILKKQSERIHKLELMMGDR